MLRISKDSHRNLTLRLEGRIIGPWVDELRLICEPLANKGQPVVLDLAEVSFADDAGIALLIRLREHGAVLRRATPLLEEQLKLARST